MSEGRAHVFPQAIGLGARPIEVPGRGSVLCVSAFLPFRVFDGAPVAPKDWYEQVGLHGGETAIPDAMVPLPGAEVLVLGPVAPFTGESTGASAGERREALLRCGSLVRRFVLHADPEAPDAPPKTGPEAAAWHEEDNPDGRGGPDDDRKPLIVDADDRERPLWLGDTPYDHALRLRSMGNPDLESGIGWPKDADPSVFHDAHPAFRAESFHPGDPLVCEGIFGHDVDLALPPYRMTFTTVCNMVEPELLPPRIHSVMLLPAVGLAAVVWRASLPLGDDTLGENVHAVIAALEDVDAPAKDELHWSDIAVTRWMEPEKALDDRPLLPAAMAAAVKPPFARPEDDPVAARVEAAQEWMREEAGLPDNPFAEDDPQSAEVDSVLEEMEDATSDEESPPDGAAVANIATAAMAKAKARHADVGFPAPEEDLNAPRTPLLRADGIDEEINRRLRGPYQADQERELHARAAAAPDSELNPEDMLGRVADARMINPKPPLPWPAMFEDEAALFGAAVARRMHAGDFERHVDVSAAAFGTQAALGEGDGPGAAAATGAPTGPAIIFTGLRLVGLLAEETVWRDVEFDDCHFEDMTFAGARFENCTFRNCAFEKVNLSNATFDGGGFQDCTFEDLNNVTDITWINLTISDCRFEKVSLMDPAMRDTEVRGGEWRGVQCVEGLLIRLTFKDMALREVTFNGVHAPHTTFERVSMFKFWSLTKGFPGSVFDRVEAETCGFVSSVHFDECRFLGTRFVETGFGSASFAKARFAEGCLFEHCDFSGSIFAETELPGTRFLNCTMATSTWQGSDASDAWFFGAGLRGVDFNDTELARAVFTDADIVGAKFAPERTIGTDFRGTAREVA